MSLNGNLYVPLGGFGRNINHDSRSWAYRAGRRGAVTPKDVGWEIHIPPMDQGNLGSCVPHAGTTMLATDPFWGTLGANVQAELSNPTRAEAFAQQLYRDVTRADPFPGAWEPDDTGSDGLTLAQVLQKRGLNNGYEHVMSIDDAHVAIQKGAYPIGISWLTGMDTPDAYGVCKVTGRSRGGHEVLVYRYDLARDLWWIRNSWGTGFGLKGDFAISTLGYQRLMDLQADGTPMTPIGTPTPVPDPVPTDDLPIAELDKFAAKESYYWPKYQKAAAEAWKGYRLAHP